MTLCFSAISFSPNLKSTTCYLAEPSSLAYQYYVNSSLTVAVNKYWENPATKCKDDSHKSLCFQLNLYHRNGKSSVCVTLSNKPISCVLRLEIKMHIKCLLLASQEFNLLVQTMNLRHINIWCKEHRFRWCYHSLLLSSLKHV